METDAQKFLVFERVLGGDTYADIAVDFNLSTTRISQLFYAAARCLWKEAGRGILQSKAISPAQCREDGEWWLTRLAWRRALSPATEKPRFVEAKELLAKAEELKREIAALELLAARDVFFSAIDGQQVTAIAAHLGTTTYHVKRLLKAALTELTGVDPGEGITPWRLTLERPSLLLLAQERDWARESERPKLTP